MVFIYVLGFVAWAVPMAAAGWYLMTFRDIHRELKLIRRYLQDLHERQIQAK